MNHCYPHVFEITKTCREIQDSYHYLKNDEIPTNNTDPTKSNYKYVRNHGHHTHIGNELY